MVAATSVRPIGNRPDGRTPRDAPDRTRGADTAARERRFSRQDRSARHRKPAPPSEHDRLHERGVDPRRNASQQPARDERAGHRARADQRGRPAASSASRRSNVPNSATFATPIVTEMIASVAISAAPCTPAAIRMAISTVPVPGHAAVDEAEHRACAALDARSDAVVRVHEPAAQRHAEDQERADEERDRAACEQRVAVGTGRARRQSEQQDAPDVRPFDRVPERDDTAARCSAPCRRPSRE